MRAAASRKCGYLPAFHVNRHMHAAARNPRGVFLENVPVLSNLNFALGAYQKFEV